MWTVICSYWASGDVLVVQSLGIPFPDEIFVTDTRMLFADGDTLSHDAA